MTLDDFLKNNGGGTTAPSINSEKAQISQKYERQHQTRDLAQARNDAPVVIPKLETMQNVAPDPVYTVQNDIPNNQGKVSLMDYLKGIAAVTKGAADITLGKVDQPDKVEDKSRLGTYAALGVMGTPNQIPAVENMRQTEVKEQAAINNERASQIADFDANDTSDVLYHSNKNGFDITRNKLDLWLQEDYKLSDAEKEQAKEYLQKKRPEKYVQSITSLFYDKDKKAEYNKERAELAALLPKVSKTADAAYGLAYSVPGMEYLDKGAEALSDKIYGTDNKDLNTTRVDAAKNTSKLAYEGGRMVGKMGQYMALNASGALAPISNTISGALSSAIGETAAGAVGNILADEVADIILDTTPELIDNIVQGKSAGEIAKEAGINVASNLAFNVGGEIIANKELRKICSDAIMDTFKSSRDAIVARFGKQVADQAEKALSDPKVANEVAKVVADAATKNTDEAVETVAKNSDEVIDAVKPAETPEIETLAKQTENLPSQEIDAVKGQNEGQMTIDDFINSTKDAPEVATPEAKEIVEPKTKKAIPDTPETRESKVYSNTLTKEGLADMTNDIDQRGAQYLKHYNAETLANARNDIAENGATILDEYLAGARSISSDLDVDRSMLLLHQLKQRIVEATDYGLTKDAESLKAQYDLLKRKLREAGTKYGQNVQAFAKWNGTAEGAINNAEQAMDKAARKWAKKNGASSKKVNEAAEKLAKKTSATLDRAFANMGNDGSMAKEAVELTHEQIEKQVRNTLEKEFASVGVQFTDDDVKFLTSLVESKTPIDIITDELEHRLNHGVWYTIDESTPLLKKESSKLATVLKNMGDDSLKAKNAIPGSGYPAKSHATIVEEIKATLEKEASSLGLDDPKDIEFLATMVEENVPNWQIEDEIRHRLATGEWYTLDESIPIKQAENTRLKKILSDMMNTDEKIAKEPLSLNELRAEVKETLQKELGSIDDFTDADIDYVATLLQSGATSKEISAALQSRIANGVWGVSDDCVKRVNELFEEAQHYAPGSKQRVETEAKIWETLADDIYKDGGTFAEKFDAFRYMAMLGNPKTQVKNILSTAEMHAVDGFSNNLAAVIEAAYNKVAKTVGEEGIERTKAVLNLTNNNDRALIKNGLSDAEGNVWAKLTGNGRWGNGADEINKARKIYKSKGMNVAQDISTRGLEEADNWFLKQKYSTSLAGYLKGNGADASIFDAEYELAKLLDSGVPDLARQAELQNQIDLLNRAREYAIKKAQYATFHADNEVADAITKFKKALRTSDNKAVNALGAMVEGFIPFVKTPTNVLKNTFDFSPVSFATAMKYFKSGDIATGIEKLAKGTTGLGLIYAGYKLADAGILRGAQSDYDKSKGYQDYSINIGNKSMSIADVVSGNAALLVGVALHDNLQNKGYSFEDFVNALDKGNVAEAINMIPINDVANSVKGAVEPIAETSMLTGVTNLINAVRYAEGNPIVPVLGTMAAGYATQVVPTVAGQLARTIDNTRRSTYTPETGLAGTVVKNVEKIQNKIPFVSKANEPYVDMWGREQQSSPTDNPLLRTAYQFAFPSYMGSIDKNDPVFNELDRLGAIEGIGQDTVSPGGFTSSIGGVKMSQEEYTKYAKSTGEARYNGIELAISNPKYQDLSDESKAEVVKGIYNLANYIGKNEVTGNGARETNAEYKQYYNNGNPDLNKAVDHIISKYALSNSGLKTTNEDAQAAFAQGGQAGLDAYTGVSAAETQASREATAQEIPNLDYSQILKTTSDDVNAKAYVDPYTAIPYLRDLGLDNEKIGEVLYNSGDRSKEEIAAYNQMGGYTGVAEYYSMKADGSSLNPDGSPSSLDMKEIAAYLYNQYGYNLNKYNEWLQILGKKTVDEKKYNKNLEALGIGTTTQSTEIPQVTAPTSNSSGTMDLNTYLSMYGGGR